MLKDRNRGRFESRLIQNVRHAVDGLGYPVRARRRDGLLLLRAPTGPTSRRI
ncbi:hypothetical protein [Streptomyces spiralis]|uniref:hypothetical protein n=1 Tax=Streptomyces spiralis TaxID=66376 RepID=UPI003681127B